jgi:hypothetical protein
MRIRITDMADVVIYDNMISASGDNSSANVQSFGGGSVQIHSK